MEVRHPHVPELQSLRGVAALAVLLHHCSFLFVTSAAFHFWAEAFINAHAAVVIFYVLSGYVLVRSLQNKAINAATVSRFYVGRVFRIYPALWAVCALAALYLLLVHFRVPTDMASSWYEQYFIAPPRAADIVKNMAASTSLLIPPTWSVRIELLASVVIPFICVLVRRVWGPTLLVVSVVAALATAYLTRYSSAGVIYMPSFIIGALAFRYQSRWGAAFGNVWILSAAAIALVFFRQLSPAWRFGVDYHAVVPTLVESLCGAVLIMGVVAHPVSWLRTSLVVRLGDISYSLYLAHFIVMSVIAKFLGQIQMHTDLRALVLMISTLAVTWPLAAFSYAYIEKPGIRLGRGFFDSFRARVTAAAP